VDGGIAMRCCRRRRGLLSRNGVVVAVVSEHGTWSSAWPTMTVVVWVVD
jgi:hypothetical protein